ncbi:MAG: ABC transporter permease subunit [Ectothiorhodospiraceae bacterium]|nr:ABC transporter permease subunit [Ectothiorhodospiraceae bacterium]
MAESPDRDGHRLVSRLLADGLVVAVVVVWWLLSTRLPEFVLPGPGAVLERLVDLFTEPELVSQTALSAARVVGSVVVAVLAGSLLALLARFVPLLTLVVERRLQPFLNSFPSVGWAILAVIWFDISNFSVMLVQVMILIPFCLINVLQGLRELDPELMEMARSFTRSRRKTVVRIMLPMLMPYVMAATRIAYGVGWKIALVSELFGADSGLGYLMLQAQINADAPMVFATCLAIVVLFYVGERVVLDPIARLVRYE